MTPRVRLVLSAAAVVAGGLLTAGLIHLTGADKSGLPAVGQVIPASRRPAAPDISGTALAGGRVDTSRWRGHAIMVNFWGSWYVPCRKETPVLARVARDTRFLGVRFLGIDIREDPSAGLAFERHYRIGYRASATPAT